MSQQIILPDRVVYDLVGVQRNFEALRKFIEGFTSTTFIIGSDGTPGPTERCAFILTAIDRVTGPTSNPPSVDDAYSMGFGSDASGTRAISFGTSTVASGDDSYAGGLSCIASGDASHAVGEATHAEAEAACAEGLSTFAQGKASHAEGEASSAVGEASHAEGEACQANGNKSHAEGDNTTATGIAAHAEGSVTQAVGDQSHAEGYSTQANGQSSHAEGDSAIAAIFCEHAHAAAGSGQLTRVITSARTTNATPSTFDSSGDPLTVPAGELWMVEAHVSAKQTAGTGSGLAGFRIAGLVGYPGGTLAVIDVPAVRRWGFGNGLNWDVQIDVTATALTVLAYGQASKTIEWTATIHATRNWA